MTSASMSDARNSPLRRSRSLSAIPARLGGSVKVGSDPTPSRPSSPAGRSILRKQTVSEDARSPAGVRFSRTAPDILVFLAQSSRDSSLDKHEPRAETDPVVESPSLYTRMTGGWGHQKREKKPAPAKPASRADTLVSRRKQDMTSRPGVQEPHKAPITGDRLDRSEDGERKPGWQHERRSDAGSRRDDPRRERRDAPLGKRDDVPERKRYPEPEAARQPSVPTSSRERRSDASSAMTTPEYLPHSGTATGDRARPFRDVSDRPSRPYKSRPEHAGRDVDTVRPHEDRHVGNGRRMPSTDTSYRPEENSRETERKSRRHRESPAADYSQAGRSLSFDKDLPPLPHVRPNPYPMDSPRHKSMSKSDHRTVADRSADYNHDRTPTTAYHVDGDVSFDSSAPPTADDLHLASITRDALREINAWRRSVRREAVKVRMEMVEDARREDDRTEALMRRVAIMRAALAR